MAGRKKKFGSPSANALPAPPRTNLMLVKDDVRRSLNALSPKESAELLRRVALEHSKAPNEGIAGPYIAALQEMQADRAAKLVASAGDPQVFAEAIGPVSMDDVLADAPTSTIDAGSLSPAQASALREAVDLMSAYERARTESAAKFAQLTPEEQAKSSEAIFFESSPQAQGIRSRIEDLVVLNELDDAIPVGEGQTVAGMLESVAPTLADMPAADGARNYIATRADYPMGDKLSTYMGERGNKQVVDDEPLRGDPAGQLQKLTGNSLRKMLIAAGYSPKQVMGMNAKELAARTSQFPRTSAQTTTVLDPSGSPVELTLPGGGGPTDRAIDASTLQSNIALMERMPPIIPESQDAKAMAVAQAQTASRQNQIAQLRDSLAQLLETPLRAQGDSPGAARKLARRIGELEQLPIDPSVDRFQHVLQDGGPTAFRDEESRSSGVAFLKKRLADMQQRMSRAQPGVIPAGRVAEVSLGGDSLNALRSPNQVAMEKWLQASGVTGTELSGLNADPVTGQRRIEGGEPYFGGQESEALPPKLPAFAYGIPPVVDAQGNISHPNQPMTGDQAARSFAWVLGAQDPRFAESITPTMQKSLDTWWNTVPSPGEPGTAMLRMERDPATGNPTGNVLREKMIPNKSGREYLQGLAQMREGMAGGLAGGGAGGGRLDIPPASRPRIDDTMAPSMDQLMGMPVEDLASEAPNTPPPKPQQFSNVLEELEAMGVEGDLDEAIGPQAARPQTTMDINRMLDEIPVDEDTTGFLGKTSMNMAPRRDILSALLA